MASMRRTTGAGTTDAQAGPRSVRRRGPTSVSRRNWMGRCAGPERMMDRDRQPLFDLYASLPSLPRLRSARVPASRECHWSPARAPRDRRPGRSTATSGKARPVDRSKDFEAAPSLPARVARVQGSLAVRRMRPGDRAAFLGMRVGDDFHVFHEHFLGTGEAKSAPPDDDHVRRTCPGPIVCLAGVETRKRSNAGRSRAITREQNPPATRSRPARATRRWPRSYRGCSVNVGRNHPHANGQV